MKFRVMLYIMRHIVQPVFQLFLEEKISEVIGLFDSFLVAQRMKNLPAVQKEPSSFPGLGRSLEKGVAPHPSILAEESHGQRSLAG